MWALHAQLILSSKEFTASGSWSWIFAAWRPPQPGLKGLNTPYKNIGREQVRVWGHALLAASKWQFFWAEKCACKEGGIGIRVKKKVQEFALTRHREMSANISSKL